MSARILQLVVAVVGMYCLHSLLISMIHLSLGDENRAQRLGFWRRVLYRRVWAYIGLTMFFCYFCVGVSLLPNPQIQKLVRSGARLAVQASPFEAAAVEGLDISRLEANLGVGMMASLVIIAAVRILCVKYHPSLLRSLGFTSVAVAGVALFSWLADPGAFNVIIDSVLRKELAPTLLFLTVASIVVAFVTEGLLQLYPLAGSYHDGPSNGPEPPRTQDLAKTESSPSGGQAWQERDPDALS